MAIRAIDLFSGPGGLTLGMKSAGIAPLFAVEKNKDAAQTYHLHSPDVEHFCGDIRDVSLSRFCGAADIIYGGPPCQPWSTGGLQRGAMDARDMLPAFLAAIEAVQPSVILMENVPGLAAKSRQHHFFGVLDSIASLGYVVSWTILNAADFGVPQGRRRLFIVGSRIGTFLFPNPTHGEGTNKPHVPTSAIVSTKEPFGEPANSVVAYAPEVDLRPSPYAGHVFKGGGRPINMTRPCHTVYASAGGNKTHWVDTLNIVPEYHAHLMNGGETRRGEVPGARRLSVEESALIQTFPKNMVFAGSKSSKYRQVGDAVPPLLAKNIGAALVEHLKSAPLTKKGFKPDPIRLGQLGLFKEQTCQTTPK